MLDTPHLHTGSIEAQPRGGSADGLPEHPPSQSASAAVSSILRAAEMLRRSLTADFCELGVNGARYQALRIIAQSSPDGCSQTELAAELNQSESSVSGLVSRMRADGLLYRLRSKQDQRKRLLMLSAQGRSLLAECDKTRDEQVEHLLGRFDVDMLCQLSSRLEQLTEHLAQPGTIALPPQNEPSDAPLRRSA